MRSVYLWIFTTIFNWVFDKILDPIITWISGLISTVYSWVFGKILAPILTLVFEAVMPWLWEIVKLAMCQRLYMWLRGLCFLVDIVSEGFKVFIGAQEVTYTSNGTTMKGSLLNVLISMSYVGKAFLLVTILGLAIALMLSIYGVIKSMFDLEFENKRPVTAVLRSTAQAMIKFLMIPFGVMLILNLATIILNGIQMLMPQTSAGIGGIIFAITTVNADHNSDYNAGGINDDRLMEVGGRAPIFNGSLSPILGYMNMAYVMGEFYLTEIDYFTGYILGIFLLIVMVIASITFIQRLFEVIILYLVSPLFVCTMPVDDGERFNKWKDLFLGKVFSGFGTLLCMNIFLMLVPMVMSSGLRFDDMTKEGLYGKGTFSGAISTYLIKMIFLIGGAWSMMKIGPTITSLISAQAGTAEAGTSSMVSGFVGGQITSAMQKGLGKAKQSLQGRGGGKGLLGGKGAAGGKTGNKADLKKKPDARKSAEAKKKEAQKAKRYNNAKADQFKKIDKDKQDKLASLNAKKQANIKARQSTLDAKKAPAQRLQGLQQQAAARSSKAAYTPPSVKTNDVKTKGALGFNFSYDKDGKRTGFSMPGLNFRKGEDGKMHVQSFNAFGLVKGQRATVDGKPGNMNVSDIPLLGIHRQQDKSGEFHTTSVLGMKRSQNAQGEYQISSIPMLGVKREIGADGTYSTTKIGALGVERQMDSKGEYNITRFAPLGINREEGTDGKMHVSHIGILGVDRQEGGKAGDYGVTSFSPLGIKREVGTDGDFHTTHVGAIGLDLQESSDGKSYGISGFKPLGIQREEGSDGQFHVTHVGAIGYDQEEGADHKYHMTHLGLAGVDREVSSQGEYHTTHVGAVGLHMEEGADHEYHVTDVNSIGLHRQVGSDNEYHVTDINSIGLHRVDVGNGEYEVSSITPLGYHRTELQTDSEPAGGTADAPATGDKPAADKATPKKEDEDGDGNT